MTTVLLLSALLAAEPGCLAATDGKTVTCDAGAFRLLMDDADRTEGSLNVCRGQLALAPRECRVQLKLNDDLWGGRVDELEVKLKALGAANEGNQPGFLEKNRPALTFGAGALGTVAMALGVGLAASEADPALWGSLLVGGLGIDVLGAWLALAE